MALFSAFDKRDNSSRNETTVIQDSYNATSSNTTVYDNLGNTSVVINPDEPIQWEKVLPVVAIGLVVAAVLWLMTRTR